MVLSSTFTELLEVIITGGMVMLVMGVMVAIPLAVQYYIEDRPAPEGD
jgi:hypothetical protein